MASSNYFTSSIGKKIVMSLTGIFLIIFLVVHCYVNANVLFTNGRENFNIAAHFMSSNILVRISEIGLFIGFLIHIIQGLGLYFTNKSKRPVSYKVSPKAPNVSWYSKSMTFLGTIILLFLIVHLINFWVPSRFGTLPSIDIDGKEYHDLYSLMSVTFQNPYLVVLYVLGCISLSWHLLHGFASSFNTLGISSKIIKNIGMVFSIVIPLIFILMPVFMYFNIEIPLKGLTLLF